MAADYAVPLGNGQQARLSVTDRYQGTRYSGIVGSTSLLPYRLAPYNLVDLDLSIGITDKLEVGVYAKNVFDSTLTRPRTIGVQGRFRL